jgi:hypothetical protein
MVDCSFVGAREDQVQITDLALAPSPGGSLEVSVRGGGFAIEDAGHTTFVARTVNDPTTGMPVNLSGPLHGFSNATGLRMKAPFGADLTMDGVEFSGFLLHGIHTEGGVRTKVAGCSFRFRDPVDNVFPNGAAIALERASVSLARLPTLQATRCMAATPSFLWVNAPRAGDWQKSPEEVARGITVVLTSITHRVDRSRGLGVYWPPSVVWRGGPSPFTTLANVTGNSTLTLIGCEFEVPTPVPPPTTTPEGRNQNSKMQLSNFLQQIRLGVLPRVPRVFINSDLRQVSDLGTFHQYAPTPVIGAFEADPQTKTRSLGAGASTEGPPITRLTLYLTDEWLALTDPFGLRLLFAWADWSNA